MNMPCRSLSIAVALSLSVAVLNGKPAFADRDELTTEGEVVAIGMLLPAIQKVRDAAARAESDEMGLTTNDDTAILIGMLLPAIQKVRDAGARRSFEPDMLIGFEDGSTTEAQLMEVDEFGLTAMDADGVIMLILVY